MCVSVLECVSVCVLECVCVWPLSSSFLCPQCLEPCKDSWELKDGPCRNLCEVGAVLGVVLLGREGQFPGGGGDFLPRLNFMLTSCYQNLFLASPPKHTGNRVTTSFTVLLRCG